MGISPSFLRRLHGLRDLPSPSGERQPVPLGHVNPSPLLAGCSFPSIERIRLPDVADPAVARKILTTFVAVSIAVALGVYLAVLVI